jgi:hypothetical protein
MCVRSDVTKHTSSKVPGYASLIPDATEQPYRDVSSFLQKFLVMRVRFDATKNTYFDQSFLFIQFGSEQFVPSSPSRALCQEFPFLEQYHWLFAYAYEDIIRVS